MPPNDARDLADYLIDNDGSLDDLRTNANRVYDALLALR
jgi:dephospho-CoA kinase